MPKRTDIHKILIIGSGPIVIGQACEFDYSGTQACRALKAEGYATVLVNSNPATIMTDPELADATYVEPLLPEYVERIIEKERPDALLPTMGGQTGLNVTAELHRWGVLNHFNVRLIGANYEAIHKAEDREAFKAAMERIGLELPQGGIARTPEEAEELMTRMRFPIIIRPAFTLGGTGGSIAYNLEEFHTQVRWGLSLSPISEVLVEESVIGWKEFELEVMRDLKDNVVVICSIENVDPMGIHTGDSFTVAPAQTLTDKEYQLMRDAAVRIIREIGVDTGGSNIQFAVHPETGRMLVIEMNPRVSRSSALASKATGFPIAKIAAKLAVGLTLDEIPNDITRKTPASFEPTIDYVVVKAPRWDFSKFAGADAQLGTQMKSVGEAMAIGRTFKEALGKALRSLEIGRSGLEDTEAVFPGGSGTVETYLSIGDILERLREHLRFPGATRLFWIGSALRAGVHVEEVSKLTGIDPWFLHQMADIVAKERELKTRALTPAALDRQAWIDAKSSGFSDRQLATLWSVSEETVRQNRLAADVRPVYKTVDTCAAEFESSTPYLYSTYEEENESVSDDVRKVVILGGGPNRIGQGIEFDYCCVHAVMALQEMGIQAIMINCNPETVSTDYDAADKLYFEPLTLEDVLHVLELERPEGVIVQFGGQTPLNLAIPVMNAGYTILGTSPESIDLAEDRGRFGRMLREMGIRQPQNGTARSLKEALSVCGRIGFPVLLRPSYVLGGRAMEIAYDESTMQQYMERAVVASEEHPVLIDKFLEDAFEFDVDAICDGDEVFVAGIMQHIEEAGIHSGDSSCVLPPYWISEAHKSEIVEQTRALARALHVKGLANVQYAMKDNDLYVLEVNPRASRTVPYVSKSIGLPLAKLATRVMMGQRLKDLLPESVRASVPSPSHITVKTPVFPFEKFPGARPYLGPEMKSTGEVMGLGKNFGRAFAKAQLAAGNRLPIEGAVFISVNDNDKVKAVDLARAFAELGFRLFASTGTQAFLAERGLDVEQVYKVKEGRPNVADRIINGEINLVVNTPLGKASRFDEYAISRTAIQYRVPCLTTLSASWAAVDAIKALRGAGVVVRPLQEYHPR